MNDRSFPRNRFNHEVSLRVRAVFIAAEVLMITALLAVWFLCPKVRESASLTVLFLYSLPSEFLVGLVPHEPVLIYFGHFFNPLIVALVSVAGTVIAEGINYSVFGFVCDTALFLRMRRKPSVENIIRLFEKAPFTAILVAGFTPAPFFPIRFIVVISRYPLAKYLMGVFISRAPRFYLLAGAGRLFAIPGWLIVLIFVLMIVTVNIPLVVRLLRKSKVE